MYDVFIMDMGGHDVNVRNIQTLLPHSQVVRYYDNHLDTIRRCVSRARTPWIWVVSSCCSYFDFDFDYHAAPWEAYQLHCWASGDQQFGDTFLINVSEFNRQKDIELLEWYKDVNWHDDGVPRLPWPVLETPDENITEALKSYQFSTPYVWINQRVDFHVPLWNKRAFYTFTDAGSISIAPRDVQAHLTSQIYDYPYIIKEKREYLTPKPLDIIYISNGEPDAERWYNHLLKHTQTPIKRVQNVNGRSRAYKAAAELSTTPWFFAVFAKLEVIDTFDWAWQPDWLQEPKHYIFHSRNPVNGLEYGHMGVIAYNKRLVLETDAPGLDFTLSKPHAVVPRVSAIAHYNITPELTWRTAFREALKLKDDIEKTDSVESRHRLFEWMMREDGEHGAWSVRGAQDAIIYYDEVAGDYSELMRSYEWAWLQERWASLYSV